MKPSSINLHSPEKPDETYIREMFNGLARRYDAFTFLTGFGCANIWRAETLKGLQPSSKVLDLGCGTGDLALMALRKLGPDGQVVGLDFSANMLAIARSRYERLQSRYPGHWRLVEKKAEDLPLPGEKFDFVVSGFVLRNLYENIRLILKGVHESLKPGGQIRFLDLTEPKGSIRKKLFRWYMMTFVGFYGAILFGKKYPIPYLPDSATRFLKTDEFTRALSDAGFTNVTATSFMLGSVTLYGATKN